MVIMVINAEMVIMVEMVTMVEMVIVVVMVIMFFWDIYLQVIVWIVKLITEYTDGILSVYVCLIPVDHCMQSTSTTFCNVLILHIKVIFNRFFEFGTEDVVSAEGNNCL